MKIDTDQTLGTTETTLRLRVDQVDSISCWGKKQPNTGRRDSKKPGAKASTWEFFVQMCWEEQKHPHASANFLGLSTKR